MSRRFRGPSLASVILVWALTGQWGYAGVLECKPEVKYECSVPGCARQVEGFAHAEHYRYDSGRGVLTACLWSGCFEGKVRRAGHKDRFVVSGDLSGPKGERSLISLTITPDGRFTADWHDSAAPVLAFGACRPEGKRP